MGTTTSTTYVTNANATTPTPVIVCNVPSDILGLAVTNLNIPGVSPVPGDDIKNNQTIEDNIRERTISLFQGEFEYEPDMKGKTLPADIKPSLPPSTVKPQLKKVHVEGHWYYPDDPKSDVEIKNFVEALLFPFNKDALFDPDGKLEFKPHESYRIVQEVIKDIKKVSYLNYSVWTSDTDNYHGPLKELHKQKVRAQIDIAYYAFRGKSGQGKDGVYIYIAAAAYTAEFNPF